jgi:hypothetical protein
MTANEGVDSMSQNGRLAPTDCMQISDEILKAVAPLRGIAGGVLCAVGIAKTFEWFNGMIGDSGRKSLSGWLRNSANLGGLDSWGAVFPMLIDRVFGEDPKSQKFFVRSCVASLIAVSAVVIVYIGLSLNHPTIFKLRPIVGFWGVFARMMVYSPFFLIVCTSTNFLPDYLSLLISRKIVRWMALKPTVLRVILLLVADTLATAIVASLSVFLFYLITLGIRLPSFLANFHAIWSQFFPPRWLSLTGQHGFAGIFFYSGFFTSIWVWIYILSGWLIKIFFKIRSRWASMLPNLNTDEPMVLLGRVAGVLVGIAWGLVLGLSWLNKHIHI